jgi:hypothetical protein
MGNKNQRGEGGGQPGASGGNASSEPVSATDFFVRQVGHHGLPHGARSIAYSAPQGLLALGTDTGIVKVFGTHGVESTFVCPDYKSAVTHMVFSHSGSTLIAVHANTTIRLLDVKNQRIRATLKPGWTGAMVSSIHLCPKSASAPFLYLGTDEGSLHVLHLMKMEFAEYVIDAEMFGVETDDEDNDDEVVAIASNPNDANEVLVAHEFSGIALWNLTKRRSEKRFACPKEVYLGSNSSKRGGRRGSFHGVQLPSLASVSWHPYGRQFVAGYTNGAVVVYDTNHKASGKIQPIHYDSIAMPKQLLSVVWASDMKGKNGPGHIIVSGGHETCGVTILWQNPMHKKAASAQEWIVGDVALPMTGDGPVSSMLMPTWDSSPIMQLLVTYPQPRDHDGLTPGTPRHPSGYIALSGDPQDGIHPRLYVQALPSEIGNALAMWPPIANDPPEPTPQIMHFPSPLRRTMVVLIKDFGLCPDSVLKAIKATRTRARYPMGWAHPISGGKPDNGESGRRSLVASGHIDGTVCLWAAAAPTDGVSVELEEEGAVNSSLDLVYEFEPRLLCEADGYKPPKRPAITCIELHLAARVLCVGTESGDVLICAVRPGGRSQDGESESSGDSGSSVFLMHCIQNVHTSRIIGISLQGVTGLLAIADSSGKCSVLDVDTGEVRDINIPEQRGLTFGKQSYRNDGPIRAVETAMLPEENGTTTPCAVLGMSNGNVTVARLTNAAAGYVISGGEHSDPITNMLVVDARGLAPSPSRPKLFKRLSEKAQAGDASTEALADEAKPETSDTSSGATADTTEDAAPAEGDDGAKGDSKTNPAPNKPATERPAAVKKQFLERFVVIVAGHDVRVHPLKTGSKGGNGILVAKNKPLAHAALDGTSVASGASVVVSRKKDGKIASCRCLISVDTMNAATILSLPRLNVVATERLPTVGMSDYLRHVSILDSGDVFLVTELSVVHRLALTSTPTLGNGNGPTLVVPDAGNSSLSTAQKVAASKKRGPKRSVFGTMFGGAKAPVDLNKVFSMSAKKVRQDASVSELLGSIPDDLSAVPGDLGSVSKQTKSTINDTQNVMAQNLRKVEERGEKINELQEATSKMMLNAMRFEEQSRQIRKQAEKDAECVIS